MRILCSFLYVIALTVVVEQCRSLAVTGMKNLYTNIFTNYDKRLLPLKNQTAVATVSLRIRVFSINDFDERSGTISLSLMLTLTWMEERISWNPADYGGKMSLPVRSGEIWHPTLFLIETSDDGLTNTSIMPRIYFDGTVTWFFGKLIHATCSVDVTYFPFDTQHCRLRFGPNSYFPNELNLRSPDLGVTDARQTKPSSQWKLLDSSFVQNRISLEICTIVQVSLHLQRRVKFFVVYVIIPIICLSFLNILVFVLPNDSGERLTLATTMILSFVVYMDLVNNNVPESSEPMSFFYYYLLFLVVYSSCIMLFSVVSLRLHNKTSEVPLKIQIFVRLITTCHCFEQITDSKVPPLTHNQNRHEPVREIVEDDFDVDTYDPEEIEKKMHDAESVRDNDLSKTECAIRWDEVGRVFDISCLVILGMTNIVMTTLTFDILINNK